MGRKKKLGRSALRYPFRESHSVRGRELVRPRKLARNYKFDVYKYSDEIIPYIRFYKGRKKIREFPLTTAARVTVAGFMVAIGIPNADAVLILDGIYKMLAP